MKYHTRLNIVLIVLAASALCSCANAQVWQDLKHTAGPLADPLAGQDPAATHDAVRLTSMLSPGILTRMKTSELTYFGDMQYGLGGPTFFIAPTKDGAKAFALGETLKGEDLAEGWLVVSFQGARNWAFDAPWMLSLQRKPTAITLTKDGLSLEFPKADTGYVFSLPLYGYDKPPQQNNDFAKQYKLPDQGVYPWQWKQAVPKDVVERCRWWNRVAKAYPTGFQESYSVDPSKDAITFRNRYAFMTYEDDWNTQPLKFAMISPGLALARKYGMEMEISTDVQDVAYFTSLGPVVGATDCDELSITLNVLQYTNELEQLDLPAEPTAEQAAMLKEIREAMANKFRDPWRYVYDHGGRGNFVWNIVGDVWYPKGLAFVDEQQKDIAAKSFRIYLADDVIRMHSPHRGWIIIHGPGIGSWGSFGDAGKFSTNALQPIWAYAQYSGDWDLIRERWDMIRRFFVADQEAGWAFWGRSGCAEMGDLAPPCSALARMAWQVEDYDSYLLGAYMFARELTVHYLMQHGGDYFYRHQPYNELHPMPERIFPTDIWGSTAGWQTDGPIFGRSYLHEHQSNNRWVRFHDPDVGRFYQDHLRDDVKEEIQWQRQAKKDNTPNLHGPQTWHETENAHTMTSYARVRSFVLGEPFEEFTKHTKPADYTRRNSEASRIATSYAFLRSMTPISYQRLVPKDTPASPYVLGLQAEIGLEDHDRLVQQCDGPASQTHIQWHMPGMKKVLENAGMVSFGQIRGDFGPKVTGAKGSEWLGYGCKLAWADMTEKRNVGNAGQAIKAQQNAPVMIIGPFSNANDNEITTVAYGLEKGFDASARYDGADGKVGWQQAQLKGNSIDLKDELLQGQSPTNTLAYIQQYITSPVERTAWLKVWHYGGYEVFVNNEKVASANGKHAYMNPHGAPAEVLIPLRKGSNRILIKLAAPGKSMKAKFEIRGLDGQVLSDIDVKAKP